jgi:hypothetical protein
MGNLSKTYTGADLWLAKVVKCRLLKSSVRLGGPATEAEPGEDEAEIVAKVVRMMFEASPCRGS